MRILKNLRCVLRVQHPRNPPLPPCFKLLQKMSKLPTFKQKSKCTLTQMRSQVHRENRWWKKRI